MVVDYSTYKYRYLNNQRKRKKKKKKKKKEKSFWIKLKKSNKILQRLSVKIPILIKPSTTV